MDGNVSANEINHQLRTVLQFTLDDLEANRTGLLSDSQLLDVRNKLLFQIAKYVGLSFLPLIVMIRPNPGSILPYVLWVSLIVFIVGWFYRQWQVDVGRRHVECAEGVLSKESYTNDQMLGRVDYTLIVSGERIGVSEQGYRVFAEGEAYRVFYTAQGRQAISAEYLS